ncbi:hypothetical protein K523DRAFT_326057 [Schizophyllum commune Tattone D]|nr:hypothetical protein K523DRAFT_326057 [Schizophyllum commune Tattone D]
MTSSYPFHAPRHSPPLARLTVFFPRAFYGLINSRSVLPSSRAFNALLTTFPAHPIDLHALLHAQDPLRRRTRAAQVERARGPRVWMFTLDAGTMARTRSDVHGTPESSRGVRGAGAG